MDVPEDRAPAEARIVSSEVNHLLGLRATGGFSQSIPSFTQGPTAAVAVARQISLDPALNSNTLSIIL